MDDYIFKLLVIYAVKKIKSIFARLYFIFIQ